ncbi:hypothetical protein WA158_001785 [Blastocystis sp. Blastoise]
MAEQKISEEQRAKLNKMLYTLTNFDKAGVNPLETLPFVSASFSLFFMCGLSILFFKKADNAFSCCAKWNLIWIGVHAIIHLFCGVLWTGADSSMTQFVNTTDASLKPMIDNLYTEIYKSIKNGVDTQAYINIQNNYACCGVKALNDTYKDNPKSLGEYCTTKYTPEGVLVVMFYLAKNSATDTKLKNHLDTTKSKFKKTKLQVTMDNFKNKLKATFIRNPKNENKKEDIDIENNHEMTVKKDPHSPIDSPSNNPNNMYNPKIVEQVSYGKNLNENENLNNNINKPNNEKRTRSNLYVYDDRVQNRAHKDKQQSNIKDPSSSRLVVNAPQPQFAAPLEKSNSKTNNNNNKPVSPSFSSPSVNHHNQQPPMAPSLPISSPSLPISPPSLPISSPSLPISPPQPPMAPSLPISSPQPPMAPSLPISPPQPPSLEALMNKHHKEPQNMFVSLPPEPPAKFL